MEHKNAVLIALIGAIASIVCAYITAGKAFDQKFDALSKRAAEIEDKLSGAKESIQQLVTKQEESYKIQQDLSSRFNKLDKNTETLQTNIEKLHTNIRTACGIYGQVNLSSSLKKEPRFLRAFVATGSKMQHILISLNECNHGDIVQSIYAGVRNYGENDGVMISLITNQDIPDDFFLSVNIFQEDAEYYKSPILYVNQQ